MKNIEAIHIHSFARYSETFEPLKKTCKCGGCFNCVNLQKSDHNTLTLVCNNRECSCMTIAIRFREGRIR